MLLIHSLLHWLLLSVQILFSPTTVHPTAIQGICTSRLSRGKEISSESYISKFQDVTSETLALAGVHMSSFRPGDSAKLYASPESVMTSVGYRPTTNQSSAAASAAHRSQSVPPPRNRKDPSATYKMQVTAGRFEDEVIIELIVSFFMHIISITHSIPLWYWSERQQINNIILYTRVSAAY